MACGPVPVPGQERCRPKESQPLRITRLGPGGEDLSSVETENHTVHLAPGRYEIGAAEAHSESRPTQVIVSAGQELAITLENDVE
jgi:hypothetical protein